MSEKKRTILILCVLVAMGLILKTSLVVGAATADPGSSGDPIITKSYLDSRLSKLKTELNDVFSAGSSGTTSAKNETGVSSASGFIKLLLKKGEKVTLTDGALAILYKGNAALSAGEGLICPNNGEVYTKGLTPPLYVELLSAGENTLTASSKLTLYVLGEYTQQ